MSTKYSIMIVEDESIEREATTLVVNLAHQNVEVVCTAENGIQALQMFNTHKPDIVIMDINLPGISGLEVIRNMQEKQLQTQYIILSAYNTFSYAQKALKMGVHEYLLKPCNMQEMKGALDSVISSIETNKSTFEHNKIFKSKIEAIRPVLESECIFSIVSMRDNTPIDKIFDFMDINAHNGFVFAIKTETSQRRVLSSVKINMETLGITCIGEIVNGLCIFIALSENVILSTQIETFMDFIASLFEHENIRCVIGAGLSSAFGDALRRSYEQAVKALSYADTNNQRYIVYSEKTENINRIDFNIKDIVHKICTQIELQDKQAIERELKKAFSHIMLQDITKEKQDALIYRIYVQIVSMLSYDIESDEFEEFELKDIQNCEDLSVACDKMYIQLCLLLDNNSNSVHYQNVNKISVDAVNYIMVNYKKDINLNQTAKIFNITPFYLSKLIKKHTGKTFTDYLTYFRVAKAKTMILRQDLSIKEVTYAVGFNSQSYFSKVFKKYTGFTPGDYRNHYLKGNLKQDNIITED